MSAEGLHSGRLRRIVLIGFRGAGKSTLAAALARRLHWPLYATDRLIEQRSGLPIAQIVARYGWPRFRALEREIVGSLPEAAPCIVDCGGGVVESAENLPRLQKNALVVWVDAPEPVLLERLAGQPSGRPLLSESDLRTDLQQNYRRRLPLYRALSHLRVDTAKQSVEACCETILKHLEQS
ncbi:MAG: shikimate kinase [Calditrichaeota bacterium]|nr:MAG: shikimate kinase [Calditrichota bacterium]